MFYIVLKFSDIFAQNVSLTLG